MKLSAYIIKHDYGFAPNPFGRVCTLACCKPSIRRNAEIGDIIVGTGSKKSGLSGHLIYAMQVNDILTYKEYWQSHPSKRPSSKTAAKHRGDNIWQPVGRGKWRCIRNGFHDESDKKHDLHGRKVLISHKFYYFGRVAVKIPADFRRLIKTTQGHKNTRDNKRRNADLIARFWRWVRRNAPRPGRIGIPSGLDEPLFGNCDCARKHARCH